MAALEWSLPLTSMRSSMTPGDGGATTPTLMFSVMTGRSFGAAPLMVMVSVMVLKIGVGSSVKFSPSGVGTGVAPRPGTDGGGSKARTVTLLSSNAPSAEGKVNVRRVRNKLNL